MNNLNILNSGNVSGSSSGGGGGSGRYLGQWDAATNTPTLPNPPTSPEFENGDYYQVSVGGTQFGIDFTEGDKAIVAPDGANFQWVKETAGVVDSVSGNIVDETDPANPVVNQVQSDWNATSGLGQILNQPVLEKAVELYFVDNNRTDTYTADGTLDRPFKTINAAIAKASSNGNGASTPYAFSMLNGTYAENVDLNNRGLFSVTLFGLGRVAINPSSGAAITSNASNTDLQDLIIHNIEIDDAIVIKGSATANNFKTLEFRNCWIGGALSVETVNNVALKTCGGGGALGFTNANYMELNGGALSGALTVAYTTAITAPQAGLIGGINIFSTPINLPTFTTFTSGASILLNVRIYSTKIGTTSGTVTVPANCSIIAYNSTLRGNWINTYTNALTLQNSIIENGSTNSIFDCVVDGVGAARNYFATVKAAVDAGKIFPIITADITETADMTLTQSICVYKSFGKDWNLKRIDADGNSITVYSHDKDNGGMYYNPAAADEPMIYNDGGFALLTLQSIKYQNYGSFANTPINESGLVKLVDAQILAGNADNAGVNFISPRSSSSQSQIFSTGGAGSSNMVYSPEGNHTDLTLVVQGPISGRVAYFGPESSVSILNVDNQSPCSIELDGASIIGLKAYQDGLDMDVNVIGNETKCIDINVSNLSIASGVSGTKIIGSNASASFTDLGTGTIREGNNNIIGNDDQSDLTIFTSLVAPSGGTYTTVKQSYDAGSKIPLVSGIVVETDAIEISSGDLLNVTIDSSSSWQPQSVDASGGTGQHLNINLNDSSSVLEFGGIFDSFDALSLVNIDGGGGGLIKNIYSTGPAPIAFGGTFSAQNLRFLLGNFENSGFQTNTKTNLQEINFIGGGVNCEVGILSQGGILSNITFSGTWKDDANLNEMIDATPVVASNILVNTIQDVVFNAQGTLSNIQQIGAGELTVIVNSNTEIDNVNADNVVLLADAENIAIEGNGISDLYFANDNSNTNIAIKNARFPNVVEIYGTNITFDNCQFEAGYITYTGSSGSFINCSLTATATITENGLFRKSGNDLLIGNDYIKNNYNAASAPTATDDKDSGWSVGSFIFVPFLTKLWFCTDNTVGAAVWKEITLV